MSEHKTVQDGELESTDPELEATRQELQRAHRELERLRTILDTTVDGIVTLDDEGRIKTFNQAAEVIFGWRSREVLGHDITVLMPPSYRAEYGQGGIHRYLEAGEPDRIGRRREVTGCRRDGTTFPLEIAVAGVRESRGPFTAVLRDVSERRNLERELRQAQKMEAVGRLAAGIAHDFNNVLTGIIGCADIALFKAAPDSSLRPVLEELKRAATSGTSVVSQLLAFSRKEETELQPVAPDEVVERVESMLRPVLGEAIALRIRRNAPDAYVRAVPGQLEQVLVNLAVNARDAMTRGGALHIETAEIQVDETAARSRPGLGEGPHVLISVSDTGHGMGEQTRANAFEPFYTTKSAEQGTGLGLSTVYGIVRRLGGHVGLDTEVNRGTTFTIHLPRCAPPAAVEWERTALADHEPQGETVLVVEDDRLVRSALRHYLERHGYRVLEAIDGKGAGQLVRSRDNALDLLITDMVLPDGSTGVRVARDLHANRPHTPVIYMSAHPRHMLVDAGQLPPDAAPLQKPFTEQALLQEVRRALQGRTGSLAPRRGPAHARHTVLVVEDHAISREAMKELLEELGFRVLGAADADEAHQVVEAHHLSIDLMLVDFRLGSTRGDRLARKVRDHTPELPVVYVSGHRPDDDVELRHALNDHAATYLGKPVSIDELTRAISSMIGPID